MNRERREQIVAVLWLWTWLNAALAVINTGLLVAAWRSATEADVDWVGVAAWVFLFATGVVVGVRTERACHHVNELQARELEDRDGS